MQSGENVSKNRSRLKGKKCKHVVVPQQMNEGGEI